MLEPKLETTKVIINKFGKIVIDLNSEISFPLGLLGMEEYKRFAIAPCTIAKFSQFVLLQSLDADELVFLVLPIDLNSQKIYKAEDVKEALTQSNIKKQDCAMLLIAGTKVDEEGKKRITVNTRAPVVIDTNKKLARQYVLQNPDYEVQKVL